MLDTSVLWPSLQRDFLLSLAAEGLYRPLWSSAILGELEDCEYRKLVNRRGLSPQAAAERAARLVEQMSVAFDDAQVEGWEPLEGSFGLPDPDDEHVVAAAVIGGAGVIVTANRRDFPPERLPSTVRSVPPAEFLRDTVATAPHAAAKAVGVMADRSGRVGPPMSFDEVLLALDQRYGCTEAVDAVRAAGPIS